MSSPRATNRIFHDFFPPPRFLEMPAVGLDISDSAITAIELVHHRGAFAVGRFGRRSLPEGAFDSGAIGNGEAIVRELAALREELSLDFVNASLSEEKAYLFQTRIPHVAKKEMRSVLDFKIEENVPIPAQEAIFDYSLIEKSAEGDTVPVSVTVLPQTVVAGWNTLLTNAGLIPLSFELQAQAVARAMIAFGDPDTFLILNFGERRTGLSIVRKETVHFTSTVSIGGRHITEALAKQLSVSVEEAERIKREQGVADRKNMDVFLSVMNAVSALTDEAKKLVSYWRTHEKDAEAVTPVKRVLLAGREAGLAGFDEYLSRALELPVSVGNVWQNVCSFDEYIPPIPLNDALDFAAAIGLALPKGH